MYPGGGGGGPRSRRGAGGNARDNDYMNPFADAFSRGHGKPSKRNIDNDDWSMNDDMRRHQEYKSKRKLNESDRLNVANLIRAR
jgi:hypothetical protein